jgi:hypothetical protein
MGYFMSTNLHIVCKDCYNDLELHDAHYDGDELIIFVLPCKNCDFDDKQSVCKDCDPIENPRCNKCLGA